ncbi:MAG: DUF4190 domain-containing protein [Anaerolineales bacterium]|nr:DUF4190 domain-containing protein [Anaerolineales bacterium]
MSNYPPPPGPPPKPNSTLAIVSLIAGILGFIQIVPIIGPIVAVITGHMAKNEIRTSMGQLNGDGLATAGLILGYIPLVLGVLACCVVAILVALGMVTIPFVEAMY